MTSLFRITQSLASNPWPWLLLIVLAVTQYANGQKASKLAQLCGTVQHSPAYWTQLAALQQGVDDACGSSETAAAAVAAYSPGH